MSTLQYVALAKAKHGEKYNYDNTYFIGSDKTVSVLCVDCDKTFVIKATQHVHRGDGCPICTVETTKKKHVLPPYTTFTFFKKPRFRIMHKGKYIKTFSTPFEACEYVNKNLMINNKMVDCEKWKDVDVNQYTKNIKHRKKI